jgi:hypothetical protein
LGHGCSTLPDRLDRVLGTTTAGRSEAADRRGIPESENV